MAALALIFECAALLLMMPLGLSEAIVQRVSLFDALDRATRQAQVDIVTQASICVTFAYILLLVVIYFVAGINIPVLLLFDKSSHQELIAILDGFMTLGFLVAALHTFVIIMASILRGLLDVNTSMFVSLTCYWGVGLGLTFILVEIAGLEAWFGLASVVIALAVSAVSVTWRLWLLRVRR
jgi:MATE family multidrug resistance protein